MSNITKIDLSRQAEVRDLSDSEIEELVTSGTTIIYRNPNDGSLGVATRGTNGSSSTAGIAGVGGTSGSSATAGSSGANGTSGTNNISGIQYINFDGSSSPPYEYSLLPGDMNKTLLITMDPYSSSTTGETISIKIEEDAFNVEDRVELISMVINSITVKFDSPLILLSKDNKQFIEKKYGKVELIKFARENYFLSGDLA